jgi:hypothetical protein
MNPRFWKLASLLVVIWRGTAAAHDYQNLLGPPSTRESLAIRGTSASNTRAKIRIDSANVVIGTGFIPLMGPSKLLIFNSAPGGTSCVSYTLPPTGWTQGKRGNLY